MSTSKGVYTSLLDNTTGDLVFNDALYNEGTRGPTYSFTSDNLVMTSAYAQKVSLVDEEGIAQSLNISSGNSYPVCFLYSNYGLFVNAMNGTISVSKFDRTSFNVTEAVVSNTTNVYSSDIDNTVSANSSGLFSTAWGDYNQGIYIASADFSKDIEAPYVEILNSDITIVNKKSYTLNWDVSDNLNQLTKVEIYKVVGSVSSLVATVYNAQQTSYTINLNEATGVDAIAFQLKAYDYTGNIGVDLKSMALIDPVEISRFDINYSVVDLGQDVIFSWDSDGGSKTPYTVYRRPFGLSDVWLELFTVVGVKQNLYTIDSFAGVNEFKIVSGAEELMANGTLDVNGSVFEFYQKNLSESGEQKVFGDSSEVILSWSDNAQVVLAEPARRLSSAVTESNIRYDIWIKYAGDLDFSYVGSSYEPNYVLGLSGDQAFEWKVITSVNGNTYESEPQLVVPMSLLAPANLMATFGYVDGDPALTIEFDPVSDATGYYIYKYFDGAFVERFVSETNSYLDSDINYGFNYAYSVVSVMGDVRSIPSGLVEVDASKTEPFLVEYDMSDLGITENNRLLTLEGNSVTIRYVPSIEVDYEHYEVQVSGSGMDDLGFYTTERSFTLNELPYATVLTVNIYPLDYLGRRLSDTANSINVVTPFDTRNITDKPIVMITENTENSVTMTWNVCVNADYYLISRTSDGVNYEQLGISTENTFTDLYGLDYSISYQYQVTAVNGNMSNSSTLSDPASLVISAPEIFRNPNNLTIALPEGATFTVDAISPVSVLYRWERSIDGGNSWRVIVESANKSYANTGINRCLNNAKYRVIASNEAGEDISSAALLSLTMDGVKSNAQLSLEESLPVGLSIAESAIEADPDGDGYSNLIEYAFDSNPYVSDVISQKIILLEGGEMLIEVNVRKEDPWAIYRIEVSENLIDWSGVEFFYDTDFKEWFFSVDGLDVVSESDLGDGVWKLTIKKGADFPGNFFRSGVEY
jgi:hypothetical protein